jgi:hypothetical protein
MKHLFFMLCFFSLSQTLLAQSSLTNNYWLSYLEELAENEETDENYLENLYDELSTLSENPFNINTLTKSDLERFPFLTGLQIENLLYYLYKYGPVVDIYELKNVEELDQQTIDYLLPFVYVETTEEPASLPPLTKKALKYVKQELTLGSNYTLQSKAGYSGQYAGDPLALSLRYNLNYNNKIQLGVTGEKDPGEMFWDKQHKGFDYYAVNLTLNDLGALKTLSLGDYRLSFGQGLVLNNNFSLGKTSDVVHISQKNNGVKRHVSTNETQYFSGFAGTWKVKKMEASFFYSYRNLDATADSSTIYTFQTTGYHRTANELKKRNDASVDLYGTHIQWKNDQWSIGGTAVYYSFGDKELNPELKPYNRYVLRGKNQFNAGINYTYQQKKLIFQGETALDRSGKMAAIHHLLISPASFIDWVVSYRYYMKDYNALYSKAFSESSTVQNETGFYTGIKISFLQRWEMATYWDYFTFPWLKYGIDAPSSGNDRLLQLTYHPAHSLQMNFQYKRKEKSKNFSEPNGYGTVVLPYEQQRVRYQLHYQPRSALLLKTQADYNYYTSATEKQSGWSVTQTMSYMPDKTRFQLDGALAYFHARDWNTRISIYEKSVLYSFGFPSYYGEGLRYYAVVKWKLNRALTLYLKAASTHYFDRNVIGSGPEEIDGREKSDIYCTVKYKF